MHRHGNDFSAGGANIERLFGWESKNWWKTNNQNNELQSTTLCNMYFSKKVYAVYNGVWVKAPEAGQFSRIFVLKVTLQTKFFKL